MFATSVRLIGAALCGRPRQAQGPAVQALNLSDQIDEKTLLFVIHLGQIIRKITKIVADPHLDMVAQVAV
jgi:hypothetical protein